MKKKSQVIKIRGSQSKKILQASQVQGITSDHPRKAITAFGTDGVTPEMRSSNIGQRKLWQIVAINSRDLEMLNFLDALWMPLSPRPSSAYEHPGSPDQEFLIFWPILNISCFPPVAAPSLTLQVAPGSKFRYAILTSTPLLAYDICLQQTHCGIIYDSWFLAVRLSVNLAHCHGQVLGIEWNWHVEIPLVAHDGSLAPVCEPHTALDFPEKI